MDIKNVLPILLAVMLLIFFLLIAYRKKKNDPAIRWHFLAVSVICLGILSGWLSRLSSFWIFPYIATVAILANAFFEAMALSILSDSLTPRVVRFNLIMLLAGVVIYSILFCVTPHAYLRVVQVSAFEIVILTPPAILLFWRHESSRLRVLVGLLFLVFSAVLVVRGIDAIRLGPAIILYWSSLGESIIIPGFLVYLVGGGIGIILVGKEKSEAALIRLAHYDEGSAALNRHGFIAEFDKAFEKAVYDNSPFDVLLASFDNLSALDQEYGTQQTDRIIRFVADRLWSLAGKDGFVGRLYGSEFTVFKPKCEAGDAQRLLADLDKVLGKEKPGDIEFTLTAAAIHFECPNCKDLDFPALYAACTPILKQAQRAGPGGRVAASA